MPPSPSPSTGFQETLAAAREGDREALSTLLEQFYPTVRSMVHRSLAKDLRLQRPWMESLFSTGDVVQEVFKSVMQDLGAFQGINEGAFAGYLAMVVRNRLVDSIRFHEAARRDRRRVGEMVEGRDPAAQVSGPRTQASSTEELGLFRSALSSFPERERLLLRERIERGEAFQPLAERLAYPSADAARKAFYAAQARLLLRLGEIGLKP